MEKAHEDNQTVTGVITERVKGGFTVEVGKVRAFLPGSLVDVRPVRDTSFLEGKPIEFKVIKVDQRRNNIVVSRRAVVETENTDDVVLTSDSEVARKKEDSVLEDESLKTVEDSNNISQKRADATVDPTETKTPEQNSVPVETTTAKQNNVSAVANDLEESTETEEISEDSS